MKKEALVDNVQQADIFPIQDVDYIERTGITKMYLSVRAFMEKLIDYAGLFPPADLPMETAIQNYAAFLNDQDAWMLGRFIIPSSRLHTLDPYMSFFSSERPLALSVLGSRSQQAKECLELLNESLKQIEACRDKYREAVEMVVLELPLPPAAVESPLLDAIGSGTSKYGLQTFCEMTFALNDEWESNMIAALDEIAAYNSVSDVKLGVKLRTGGVTADAFPTPKQAAAILVRCRERDLPMKFTAGLHHPVRMYRNEVSTKMHGFLNVFFAGLLAQSHDLDERITEEILADENPDHFFFTAEGLGWRDIAINVAEIQALRHRVLCSYGSCSFDEPRDELRELKIKGGI